MYVKIFYADVREEDMSTIENDINEVIANEEKRGSVVVGAPNIIPTPNSAFLHILITFKKKEKAKRG